MQSSARNGFMPSQSRADSAFHIPRTVSSTDTCQLAFCNRRGLVCRAQEAPGARLADEWRRQTVEEYRPTADEHGTDGVVVAVDHAGQPAILLDAGLGIVIERRVESVGIHDDNVGAVADA